MVVTFLLLFLYCRRPNIIAKQQSSALSFSLAYLFCNHGAILEAAWVFDNDVSLCFGYTKVSFTRKYLVGTLQLLRSDGLRTQLLFPLDVIYVFCQYGDCEPCPVTIRVVVVIYKIKYQLVRRVGLIIKSCNKWRDQNYVHHIGHSKRVLSMVTNLLVRC